MPPFKAAGRNSGAALRYSASLSGRVGRTFEWHLNWLALWGGWEGCRCAQAVSKSSARASCGSRGLTTFTTQPFQANEVPLHTYPGEAASYRVLEEWAGLGLGSAMIPQSKLTSPTVPHRPLLNEGRSVEISFEAAWNPDSALRTDLTFLAQALAASR